MVTGELTGASAKEVMRKVTKRETCLKVEGNMFGRVSHVPVAMMAAKY